jgi:hypothetical protein
MTIALKQRSSNVIQAVGKYVGDNLEVHDHTLGPLNPLEDTCEGFDERSAGKAEGAEEVTGFLGQCIMKMGGHIIFAKGQFILNGALEKDLIAHMKAAELADHGRGEFPAHKRRVEVEVDLGIGAGEATVLGSDLTHEYVTINADYRS